MMTTCPREGEVLAAVVADSVPVELRSHIDGCAICGDVARVAALVHTDFAVAKSEARTPTADIVWLRAQVRAREDAARTAARPIILTQAIAIAALCGLLVSLTGRLSLMASTWMKISEMPLALLVPIGFAVLNWIVFAPVALYFV